MLGNSLKILKEPLCVPDPAHQFQTLAPDGRFPNSLSLCDPSVHQEERSRQDQWYMALTYVHYQMSNR